MEAATLSALEDTLMPFALGDLDLVRQFLDSAKLMPVRHDSAAEVVYVIPPKAKLDAHRQGAPPDRTALAVLRPRSRGRDRRTSVRLEEAKMTLLVELLDAAFERLTLPEDQVKQIKAAVAGEVRAGRSA